MFSSGDQHPDCASSPCRRPGRGQRRASACRRPFRPCRRSRLRPPGPPPPPAADACAGPFPPLTHRGWAAMATAPGRRLRRRRIRHLLRRRRRVQARIVGQRGHSGTTVGEPAGQSAGRAFASAGRRTATRLRAAASRLTLPPDPLPPVSPEPRSGRAFCMPAESGIVAPDASAGTAGPTAAASARRRRRPPPFPVPPVEPPPPREPNGGSYGFTASNVAPWAYSSRISSDSSCSSAMSCSSAR